MRRQIADWSYCSHRNTRGSARMSGWMRSVIWTIGFVHTEAAGSVGARGNYWRYARHFLDWNYQAFHGQRAFWRQ